MGPLGMVASTVTTASGSGVRSGISSVFAPMSTALRSECLRGGPRSSQKTRLPSSRRRPGTFRPLRTPAVSTAEPERPGRYVDVPVSGTWPAWPGPARMRLASRLNPAFVRGALVDAAVGVVQRPFPGRLEPACGRVERAAQPGQKLLVTAAALFRNRDKGVVNGTGERARPDGRQRRETEPPPAPVPRIRNRRLGFQQPRWNQPLTSTFTGGRRIGRRHEE